MGIALTSLVLVAAVLPATGASPAGATAAPLITEDGIAVRIDEDALDGSVLDAIEAALQPVVDDLIHQGASGPNLPYPGRKALHVSSDVELDLDFLAPDEARPDGGLTIEAAIRDIEIRIVMDPVWPFPDCNVWVRPDDGTIEATGRIDHSALPDSPLTVEPVQATWDNSPAVTADGVCWIYVAWQAVTNWWQGIWGRDDSDETAALIERELNTVAQGVVDDLWAAHLTPAADVIGGFDITLDQFRTDDHGLIVTADVDATRGVVALGFDVIRFDVAGTTDAGVTSDLDTLLATRSEVTLSMHPNVVNQYANALNQLLGGGFSTSLISGNMAEPYLLPPAERDHFHDNGWHLLVRADQPYHIAPTGPDGRPQLQMPQATLTFYNSAFGFGQPVATFTGSVAGIDFFTERRAGMTNWGPAIEGANVEVNATLISAMPAVTSWDPDGDELRPFMAIGIGDLNDQLLVPSISFAPIEIGGVPLDLCTSCPRVPGDQRYTDFFTIG